MTKFKSFEDLPDRLTDTSGPKTSHNGLKVVMTREDYETLQTSHNQLNAMKDLCGSFTPVPNVILDPCLKMFKDAGYNNALYSMIYDACERVTSLTQAQWRVVDSMKQFWEDNELDVMDWLGSTRGWFGLDVGENMQVSMCGKRYKVERIDW